MLKRIGLFLLTNLLVILTVSITLNLLGVQPYLTRRGLNIEALLWFCLVWGFGGAFISLVMSRLMAKWAMGVEVIDPTSPGQAAWLVQTVHRLARQAGLRVMPEVGIYQSADVNAFATGPSKNRSLVAVSSGLLHSMREDEIEGVLAHEVAHIQNGDMVTLTLIQGTVNAFAMFLSRVIAYALSQRSSDEEDRGTNYFLNSVLVFVFDLCFTILGSMVVAWFSRQREFRADRGSAKISGHKEYMVAALRSLQRQFERGPTSSAAESPAFASMKISNEGGSGFLALFRTHPPLAERIAALERA
jgi:heat shock protein HtpX